MTKKQKLIEKLKTLEKYGDPEMAHVEADKAIIEYINDKEIKEAFDDITKWYA